MEFQNYFGTPLMQIRKMSGFHTIGTELTGSIPFALKMVAPGFALMKSRKGLEGLVGLGSCLQAELQVVELYTGNWERED
jgi:hypothetical protein